MNTDYKNELIKSIETAIVNNVDKDKIEYISDVVAKVIYKYNISPASDYEMDEKTNDDIIHKFEACLMIDGKSEKTIYQYKRTLLRLLDVVNKPLTAMGVYDVRLFLATEKDNGISNRSAENLRANLSAFFQWLVAEGMVEKNPIESLNRIKYVKDVKKSFSDVEIDKLRCVCKTKKERAIIEILLSTGVRVAELSGMMIADIDKCNMAVNVRNGKGGKGRITYTTALALERLQEYLDCRKSSGDYLFYNKNNTPMQPGGIRFVLNTLGKRAGIDNVHPHRFRRTFATTAYKKGLDIHEIQRLLGHANINTTIEYINADDEIIKSSYRRYMA